MADLIAALLDAVQSCSDNSSPPHYLVGKMDDDDMSVPDSPLESGDMSPTRQSDNVDKSRAVLQTYLDSLPYKCETIEEMQAHLEEIVSKITICAKSKNWLVLTTWDGALQWSVASL